MRSCSRNNRTACVVAVLNLSLCVPFSFGQKNSSEPSEVSALSQLLRNGTNEEKLDAASQLAEYGPYATAAVPDLAALLSSDDLALQYEALIALSHIGPLATKSVNEVGAMLANRNVTLQLTALDTLRQIGSIPADLTIRIEQLAAGPNAAVAIAAVRCLTTMGREDSAAVLTAIPHLFEFLSNQKPFVRNAAASAIVDLGDRVVSGLKNALIHPQSVVRCKACSIAGELGTPAVELLPVLVERLKDEDELVVRLATEALGKIGTDSEEVEAKLEQLLHADSIAVRADAMSALARFGPRAATAISRVCELLKDNSTIIRSTAAQVLGEIGYGSQQAVDALASAISDAHGGVTVRAANSLGQLGPLAVPVLVSLIQADEYRHLAVTVLGEMGPDGKAGVPSLLPLLESEDEELRREAFIALATIGPDAKSAVPELMKMLRESKDELSRAGAAYVLGNVGEQSCVPALKSILTESNESDPDQRTLRAAAWALVILQPESAENAGLALPHLISALHSERSLARREGLAAISRLDKHNQAAAPAILELARNDRDPGVRSEAFHTLGLLQMISNDALPVAVAALESDDPEIRNSATFVLGRMGTRAKVVAARLKSGTREGTELDRILAAWALARVAPSDEHNALAVPFMLKAMRYPNPKIRAEAVITLGVIGTKNAEIRSALHEATADTDENVANAAREALVKLR